MTRIDAMAGMAAAEAARRAFLKWQCRVRQMAVRERGGLPDESVSPEVSFPDGTPAIGRVVTVLCRTGAHSATPELRHIAKRTHDPAVRREAALRFLAGEHYQDARRVTDVLAATFAPGSAAARRLDSADGCMLDFRAYSQRFAFPCRPVLLAPGDPLREAAWWHNVLFNPTLPPDAAVFGFEPDWSRCIADPAPPVAQGAAHQALAVRPAGIPGSEARC